MSAGSFTRSRYEADSGEIHPVRVQPETILASIGGSANAAPTGTVTNGISARVSGSSRRFGLRCRSVTLRWTGAVPEGYEDDGFVRIPILTPAVYNAISRGSTGTYLTLPVEVVGKTPESEK
jgi:hypothetical protein